ncbi:esterase-like activity of phytase family protein [Azospirillum sp. RWY-5-1]|uniref:Esterase-like activity of phytase family protein n=1 Tax=Azospirillum oleiclasticum TaxID=2735135 RepID=A0ABX2T1F9_9PROT|nr:esterase-like activity of phytase family protein [Azospirillum oleiclasticum]NYZ10984.1 esterase-like activity of phytase family protein [Azospirillum oleiclasticum]NYZ18146.1 esterase-like activity of phytase family protein [Azospirillum oleiclasticum]
MRLSLRIALALISAGTVIAGCVAALGGPNQTRVVPLHAEQPGLAAVGTLHFRGAVALNEPEVGGLSGLVVTDGGRQFVAVSDVGRVVRGRFLFDGDGRLSGIADVAQRPLPLERGRADSKRNADSEEIAALPDGSWLVAFEREHRILRYPPGLGRGDVMPVVLPTPPGLEDAPGNGGVEAMTVFPDGRILAIKEDGAGDRHDAWIGTPPVRNALDWQRLTYRSRDGFRPTGAAALPNGDALVLERDVSLLGGWAARIVRVPAASLVAGAEVEGEELARLQRPLLTDNFEGIAVAAGRNGETLIYLVSDDNFSFLQQTLFVLLALKPD